MKYIVNYTDEEMRFLASLPYLSKKRFVAYDKLPLFKNMSLEEIMEVCKINEVIVKEGDRFTSDRLVYVIEGEVVLLKDFKRILIHGKEVIFKKKKELYLAKKDSFLLEIDLNLKPSVALSKFLINYCSLAL